MSVLGFGGRKDGEEGPKKAHLPSGSSFHYDPVLKKWVNKNGGAEKPKEELAPPPIIPVSTGPKTSHSTTTPTPRNNEKLHNSMPLSSLNGTKEVGSSVPDGKGKKRSARSKYVDVLNPDSAPKTPSFMPSFPGSSGSGQKPKMMMNVVLIV